jgi:hypothetical protein
MVLATVPGRENRQEAREREITALYQQHPLRGETILQRGIARRGMLWGLIRSRKQRSGCRLVQSRLGKRSQQ